MPDNIMMEIGSSGLAKSGGLVFEEFLPELRGTRANDVYREMSNNDPIVHAILFGIEMLIRQSKHSVHPGDEDDSVAVDQSLFIEECLKDMSTPFEGMVSEIVTMFPHGYAPMELVYKRRKGENKNPGESSQFTDGKIGWRKIALRAQETLFHWEFDESGGIEAMVQLDPYTGQKATIPVERLLLFRTTTKKSNPEGVSVLRGAYRPWYFKKRLEEIQAIGIERDLVGLPMLGVPADLFDPQDADAKKTLAKWIEQIRKMRRDEQDGFIYPLVYDENGNQLYKFELMSTGGERAIDVQSAIEYYDARMAMSIMADFITLGHDNAGTYALSRDKSALFATALEAWLDDIASVFNRHAIPRLLRLNGMDTSKMPYIVFEPVKQPTLQEFAEYISTLVGNGVLVVDDELEARVREFGGLPRRDA